MLKRKKYKVAVRHKVQSRRTKNFAVLLLSGALAAVAMVQLPSIYRKISSVHAPKWTVWRLKETRISGGDDVLRSRIQSTFSLAPGKEISGRYARRIENELPKMFPNIRRASVARSLFGGVLDVKLEKRIPVARAVGFASPQLVDETGEIYEARPGEGDELLPVSFPEGFSGTSVGAEIARLLGAVSSYGTDFPSRPSAVRYDNHSDAVTVELSDGSVLDWGTREYTAEKIARLAQVFPKARSKISGPYTVNMRYFEKGRIIISRLQPLQTGPVMIEGAN